jgi:hypothetical protein
MTKYHSSRKNRRTLSIQVKFDSQYPCILSVEMRAGNGGSVRTMMVVVVVGGSILEKRVREQCKAAISKGLGSDPSR